MQHLSQFLQHPHLPHYQAALHVLRYLKGSANRALFYPCHNDLKLHAFCDVDWVHARTLLTSLQGSVSFLALPWYLGRLKSRRLLPNLQQKQNIEVCLPQYLNRNGFLTSWKISFLILSYLFLYSATTKLLIQFFMSALNICALIVIILGISSWKVFFLPLMSLPRNSLLIL